MVEGAAGDWCILRTASAQTLPLVTALIDEGYRAWSPTEVQHRRARRAIPAQQIIVALMPSIVFAAHDRLIDLIGITRSNMQHQVWDAQVRRMIVKGVPHFRVLRVGDRYARVADGELTGLRRAERVGHTLAKVKSFQPGLSVRLMEGAGEGLRGTVDSVNGTFAKVRFPGWSLTMTVALHLLEAATG